MTPYSSAGPCHPGGYTSSRACNCYLHGQGFAYYDDIETPYEWGKLWLAYGDWLLSPESGEFDDPRGAMEAFHAAGDHFERMGALARLAEATARIEQSRASVRLAADLQVEHPSPPQESRRAPRKPRKSTELERRSEWARETFKVITRNRVLLDLLEEVEKLSRSDTSILVLGESGTGKELVASGIHRLSSRPGAFMPVNCSALPREIIESELFGHLTGAFTGAVRDKVGIFEFCDQGTVFLDEIAEMSLELQSRLLRFLETGEVRRIGATKNRSVDTRIVAATNRERGALERGDGFRPDLYYRLAHAVVTLPPLRHRGEDLDLLVSHFLEEVSVEQQKRVRLSRAARQRLVAHPWPGNIRQMRAVIRRVVILASSNTEIDAASLQLGEHRAPVTLIEELEQAERRRVVEALAQHGQSRTEAARALGMPRTTLINKMKRYGLHEPESK
jgi:two-component system, NtrC family, response regulator